MLGSKFVSNTVPTQNIRVLHVEDDDDDAFIMEEALAALPQPISLEHRCNGQEALDWLEAQAMNGRRDVVDLVIVDLNMPIMNGLEFLAQIRADARFQKLNVAVMTTATDMDVLEEARAAGANCALSKCATIDEVADQCARLISDCTTGACSNAPTGALI
jgi:CheY-like chemotaxis protein